MIFFIRYCLVVCFLLKICSKCIHGKEDELPTIAVIGSGIGGASSVHFLRELFGKDASIDVYEKSEVGGRLATLEIGGKHYESGGSIIHGRNAYMINFTQLLGLEKLSGSAGRMGMYDGQKMIFDGSQWSWLTLAQLMWRYGWDVVRLNNYIQNMLNQFERIYEHQNNGLAFTTPERLLESMDDKLMAYLHYSLEEVLTHDGFGQKIIDELAMGAMRNNYGQTSQAQAFVGSVSLAGAEDGLWCVKGGNKQVPQGLIRHSKVKVIKSKVNKIVLEASEGRPKYEVVSADSTKTYDIVIVAAPLHDGLSSISFEGFAEPIPEFPEHYHRTVATFIRGIPYFTKFGYHTLHDFPDFMLTTKESVFFKSIGKQRPVQPNVESYKSKQELPVWKVFSQRPLTDDQINELFASYEDVKVVDWKAAYPHYNSAQVNLPKFKLAPQIYYVNAIELAASAMEMEAIGGHNAALLAYNEWHNEVHLVDPHVEGQFGRQEL